MGAYSLISLESSFASTLRGRLTASHEAHTLAKRVRLSSPLPKQVVFKMYTTEKDIAVHIVYLVNNVTGVNGGLRVIREHTRRLSTRGHRVEVWTIEPKTQPYFQFNVPIKHIEKSMLSSDIDVLVVAEPACMPAIFDQIPSRKYYYLAQGDVEYILIQNGNEPYAKMLHEVFTKLPEKVKILAVSSYVQKTYKKKYGKNSILIRNGVDQMQFLPCDPMIQSDGFKVMYVFQPQCWKGGVEAFKAFEILSSRYADMEFFVIGGYFLRELEYNFPMVLFYRPNQYQLPAIYSSADVFVSSSWDEGFGLPGLEAMACGTPLVTTRSGGVSEYAKNSNSILVTPHSVGAIVKGVESVYKDIALRVKLSVAGRDTSKQFDWEDTIDTLEEEFIR